MRIADQLIERELRLMEKDIPRHRTAIARKNASVPVRTALQKGIVQPGDTVFDYGMGRGADVAHLQSQGIEATGYDPYYASDAPKTPADVVFNNYVLNVIEDPEERAQVLAEVWSLAQRAMVVAVRTEGETNVSRFEPYGDGYITSTGTFQKFFKQDEFEEFVQQVTGKRPRKIGRGIVVVEK